MKKISEKFFLSAAEIDRFSEMAAGLLQQTNVNSKDILRFRLSMENVMDIWLRELGEGISCSFSSGSKFGRAFIVLTTDGKKVNPNEYQDELRAGISNGSSLLAALGLTLEYRYEAGQNILKLTLPKGQAGQLMPVLMCIWPERCLAVFLSLYSRRRAVWFRNGWFQSDCFYMLQIV